MARPPKVTDLTGNVYGMLTVIEFAGRQGKRNLPYWLCKCECGNTKEFRFDGLTGGLRTDCGCGWKKNVSKAASKNKTHGLTNDRLFKIWSAMRYRCSSPKSPNYESYGGRGITVCEDWRNSVHKFMEWAYANGYEEHLTLERKDVDGNYEPNNCTWITSREQNFNKRNNVLIEIDGVFKTIVEWSDISGINKFTLRGRYRSGVRGQDLLRPVDINKSTRKGKQG